MSSGHFKDLATKKIKDCFDFREKRIREYIKTKNDLHAIQQKTFWSRLFAVKPINISENDIMLVIQKGHCREDERLSWIANTCDYQIRRLRQIIEVSENSEYVELSIEDADLLY